MKPKLINGLIILRTVEWTSLRKYILMFTRKDSDSFKCFTLLSRQREKLQDFNSKKWHKKNFPVLSPKAYINMLSKLHLWLEEWIVYNALRQDQNQTDVQLVKWYNRRGLYHMADLKKKQTIKRLSASNLHDLEKETTLHQLHYYTYYSDNPQKYKERGGLLNMVIHHYQKVIYDQVLLYTIEMENWGRLTKYDFREHKEKFLMLLRQVESSNNREILNLLHRVVEHYDLASFYKLKEVLLSGSIDHESELHPLITFYLIAYSGRLWAKKKDIDSEAILELHNYSLETTAELVGEAIPHTRFHNIVSVICGVGKPIDVLTFINRWYTSVNANKASTKALAYAQYYHSQHNYSKVGELLQDVEFEHIGIKIRAYSLYVIALYMERRANYEIVDYTLVKFTRFLRRNKDSLNTKSLKSSENLIRLIRKLLTRDHKEVNIDLNDYVPLNHFSWAYNIMKRE